MVDGGFFLPLPINKPVDFGSTIARGRHNECSVGAEAGFVHPVRMIDGSLFLPLPINKTEDFGSTIIRGRHNLCSVGAEAGTVHQLRMGDGDYRFTMKSFCFS